MKRYQMSESLPVGLLLAMAGGILDAYTYLNRGQVFATAETGNLVLLGVNLSQGRLDRVVYYLLPILSFAAGVLVTELLRRAMGPNAGRLHWRQPILLTEFLSGSKDTMTGAHPFSSFSLELNIKKPLFKTAAFALQRES